MEIQETQKSNSKEKQEGERENIKTENKTWINSILTETQNGHGFGKKIDVVRRNIKLSDMQNLIEMADQALYLAKETGKNKVCFSSV